MNIDEPQIEGGFVLPWKKHDRGGNSTRPSSIQSRRLPFLGFLTETARGHIVAASGELVGTFLFLFFAFSATQVANTVDKDSVITQATATSLTLFIALAFGFSLAVNAWVFFRISGGLFNPAVTLAMALVGAISWLRAGFLFVAQLLGALASAAVVGCLFPGNLDVQTKLGGGTSTVQGLFIEMLLTAQLVFTIFMLAAEKHKATFIAPVGIGLSLFVAELTGVYFTGGSLNPARSFAPAAVNGSFEGYHWIYWLGPILGSLLAAGFYKFIKRLEYETANPTADDDRKVETRAFDPDGDHSRARVTFDPAQYARRQVDSHDGANEDDGDDDGGQRTECARSWKWTDGVERGDEGGKVAEGGTVGYSEWTDRWMG